MKRKTQTRSLRRPAAEMIAAWRTRRVPLRQPDYKRQTALAHPDVDRARKVRTAGPIVFSRILVPADFSGASQRALKVAAAFARRDDASLVLLHIVEPLRELGDERVRRPREDSGMLRFARQRLRALGGKHVGAAVRWRLLVRTGSASDEIVKVAAKLRSELIIMPGRGRPRDSSPQLRSTVERVVGRAPCPVLVLPPRRPPKARAER